MKGYIFKRWTKCTTTISVLEKMGIVVHATDAATRAFNTGSVTCYHENACLSQANSPTVCEYNVPYLYKRLNDWDCMPTSVSCWMCVLHSGSDMYVAFWIFITNVTYTAKQNIWKQFQVVVCISITCYISQINT